jgi:hypothetical protein
MPLSDDEKRLITFEGFEAMYHKFLGETASAQEAYERAEQQVFELIGQQLFSGYDAFRKQQSRHIMRARESRERNGRLQRYLRPRRNN